MMFSFSFTHAEPKFRYIDTENQDKPKKEAPKPQRPAYYDNYKKLEKQNQALELKSKEAKEQNAKAAAASPDAKSGATDNRSPSASVPNGTSSATPTPSSTPAPPAIPNPPPAEHQTKPAEPQKY